RVHRLRACDPRDRLERERVHAGRGEALDARKVGERLQERDQYLTATQTRRLVRCRRCDLRDDVRAPGVADLRACLDVRRVRETSGLACTGFDDDVDSLAQPPQRLGDEGDSTFSWTCFLRDSEAHCAGDAIAIQDGPYTGPAVTDLLLSHGLFLL